MNVAGRQARIKREMDMVQKAPSEGLKAWPAGTENEGIEASISGPEDSPYADGTFLVEIKFGPNYPFEPPAVRFRTKVFHPNIDDSGRICLDSLKLPPAGCWRPSINVLQILAQLRILLVEPGLDDPLMKDIADMFRNDRPRFAELAKQWTEAYAKTEEPVSKRVCRPYDDSQEHE